MDNSVQMLVRVPWKGMGGYCRGNKLWFVHRDRFAEQRYSDGVRLCVVPRLGELAAGKVGVGSLARGSGASWASAFAFTVTSISFCWIPLTLPEICAAGLCECVDEVVEIDAVHTVVRIQLG